MANATYFPPGTGCYVDNNFYGKWQTNCKRVGVTDAMVDFLNLTKTLDNYFAAYCNNPPEDDSCPFGYCPQQDIAGPLVRIASYITTLCLSILIFYSQDDLHESYWASLLNIYSILLTSIISVFKHSLSRFHAIIAAVIVGSPLTFYNFIYAVRSSLGHNHRLDRLFGKGQIKQRLLALLTVTIWGGFVIYLILPNHVSHFSQANCDKASPLVTQVFLAPFILFKPLVKEEKGLAVTLVVPLLLIMTSWGVAIYLRRKALWAHAGRNKRPSFWVVWVMVGEEFPFVHFMSVVFVPFAYWVATIEVSVSTSNDTEFSLSFGQVLAMFVTIPPMVLVAKLVPRLWNWFISLYWVCLITRRQQPEYQPQWQAYAKPHKRESTMAMLSPLPMSIPPSRRETYDDAWEKHDDGVGESYAGYAASPELRGDQHGKYAKVGNSATHQ